MKLKPCPCGQTPKELCLEEGHTSKRAWASCEFCGEWNIDFRTNYKGLASPECRELANLSWNRAPRLQEIPNEA